MMQDQSYIRQIVFRLKRKEMRREIWKVGPMGRIGRIWII